MRSIHATIAVAIITSVLGCSTAQRTARYPDYCPRLPSSTDVATNVDPKGVEVGPELGASNVDQAKARSRERDNDWQAQKTETRQDTREAAQLRELIRLNCPQPRLEAAAP